MPVNFRDDAYTNGWCQGLAPIHGALLIKSEPSFACLLLLFKL